MKTGLTIFAIMLATTGPVSQPCVLKAGVAIGCMGNELEGGPENAADLYDRYRLSEAEIRSPSTAGFVSRFQCIRILDRARKMDYGQIAKREVATAGGPVVVRYVHVTGAANPDYRPILWIAEPYFSGECVAVSKF